MAPTIQKWPLSYPRHVRGAYHPLAPLPPLPHMDNRADGSPRPPAAEKPPTSATVPGSDPLPAGCAQPVVGSSSWTKVRRPYSQKTCPGRLDIPGPLKMDTGKSPPDSEKSSESSVYSIGAFARAPYLPAVELLSEPPPGSLQATGSSSVSAADSGWTAIEHRSPSKPVSARLTRQVVLESLLARMLLDLNLFLRTRPLSVVQIVRVVKFVETVRF